MKLVLAQNILEELRFSTVYGLSLYNLQYLLFWPQEVASCGVLPADGLDPQLAQVLVVSGKELEEVLHPASLLVLGGEGRRDLRAALHEALSHHEAVVLAPADAAGTR